ncbi:hypothetical protein Bbelb_155330 [Branchiostoma belcheri]|nr:hypothetical protein Bbelb_155330 [Branchiostoma belcheri]
MEVLKTQTEDIFRHLLHHRAPNVFPRNGRLENRAIYRKVVQVSNDVTERKDGEVAVTTRRVEWDDRRCRTVDIRGCCGPYLSYVDCACLRYCIVKVNKI